MPLEQKRKADLGNGFYQNPIFNFDKPDITVLRDGTDYYLTGSHSTFPSLPIYHSRDLVNWELLYYAITDPSYGVWGGAPDLIKYEDTYYLYLMNGGNGIYVMTCTDIRRGNWSAPQPLHLGPVGREDWPEGANPDHWDYNLGFIDPGHVVGEDGKRYLFVSGGFMVGLSDDGLRVVTKPRKVYEPWPIPDDWFIEGYYIEAMSLFKRGEYFYLMAAQGGTFGPATGHMAISMRSKSVFGPWEHSPYNPIVHAGSDEEPWWCRGHATVLEDTEGNWWILYHAEEKGYRNHGRKTLMEPIAWDDKGWFRVPDGIRPEDKLKKPAGEAVPDTIAFSDTFTGPSLGLQWGVPRQSTYDPRNYVFRDSGLALKAFGSSLEKGDILVLNNGDHSYRMIVELEPETGVAGGMGLYLCPQCYISLEFQNGELSLCRPARGGAFWKKSLHATRLQMALTCIRNNVTFQYREENGEWQHIRFDTEISTWCQDSFGAVPVHPALFSYGSGSTIFRNFVYKGLE